MEQTQLADMVGMSRAYIYRLEAGGIINPKLFDLNAIADALHVPLDALLRDSVALTEDEQLDFARLDDQFKDLVFATGRKYQAGTDAEKRTYLNVLRALAGEEYREPEDDGA